LALHSAGRAGLSVGRAGRDNWTHAGRWFRQAQSAGVVLVETTELTRAGDFDTLNQPGSCWSRPLNSRGPVISTRSISRVWGRSVSTSSISRGVLRDTFRRV